MRLSSPSYIRFAGEQFPDRTFQSLPSNFHPVPSIWGDSAKGGAAQPLLPVKKGLQNKIEFCETAVLGNSGRCPLGSYDLILLWIGCCVDGVDGLDGANGVWMLWSALAVHYDAQFERFHFS